MPTQDPQPDCPVLREGIRGLYRDFFDRAEKKRRWSLRDDIPWDQVNRAMDPAVADVVESFCAVELFLPDYISKALPLVRKHKVNLIIPMSIDWAAQPWAQPLIDSGVSIFSTITTSSAFTVCVEIAVTGVTVYLTAAPISIAWIAIWRS